MQTSIFDNLYPKYKITKPIRLIEFFAGYGSQALALKYLGLSFEHWKICEWAVKSIQAYKDIHFTNDNTNYSERCTTEEIQKILLNYGISSNYNEPMTKEQINKIGENQLRRIYNNIIATKNLVNIQQVKGEDLEIKNTDKYDYILTYSFPCQDLSNAGKKKGMSDTTTRSGLLWEVERILIECQKLNNMPQILLMENVPQVHSAENVQDFNKWQLKLEQLGYKNYWEDLIATDYEIPQTRNRCFMVSILGDYNYSFPQPKELKLRLKDMLEEEVDDKYFLSDKMLAYCFGVNQKDSKYNRREVFERNLNPNKDVAYTITTCAGNRATDNFIVSNVVTIGNYSPSNHNASRIVDKNFVAPTVMENHGTITAIVTTRPEDFKTAISPVQDLRIRKLTPKECWRLMGVKDEDFENCNKNQSNASLYHLAGDSIVVNVLMAIFKELI